MAHITIDLDREFEPEVSEDNLGPTPNEPKPEWGWGTAKEPRPRIDPVVFRLKTPKDIAYPITFELKSENYPQAQFTGFHYWNPGKKDFPNLGWYTPGDGKAEEFTDLAFLAKGKVMQVLDQKTNTTRYCYIVTWTEEPGGTVYNCDPQIKNDPSGG